MNMRRCGRVVGTTAGIVLIAWLLGIFMPSALAPHRILDGGTRVFITVAVVLVTAMVVVSSCRREQPDAAVAKTGAETRNKTTR